MTEKKESVIKVLGRKIRRIFRGELESEKRLEELRKKYEEKNPGYVAWEDFYYCTIGFQKDIAAIKERTNIILCILISMVAYLISKAII